MRSSPSKMRSGRKNTPRKRRALSRVIGDKLVEIQVENASTPVAVASPPDEPKVEVTIDFLTHGEDIGIVRLSPARLASALVTELQRATDAPRGRAATYAEDRHRLEDVPMLRERAQAVVNAWLQDGVDQHLNDWLRQLLMGELVARSLSVDQLLQWLLTQNGNPMALSLPSVVRTIQMVKSSGTKDQRTVLKKATKQMSALPSGRPVLAVADSADMALAHEVRDAEEKLKPGFKYLTQRRRTGHETESLDAALGKMGYAVDECKALEKTSTLRSAACELVALRRNMPRKNVGSRISRLLKHRGR